MVGGYWYMRGRKEIGWVKVRWRSVLKVVLLYYIGPGCYLQSRSSKAVPLVLVSLRRKWRSEQTGDAREPHVCAVEWSMLTYSDFLQVPHGCVK